MRSEKSKGKKTDLSKGANKDAQLNNTTVHEPEEPEHSEEDVAGTLRRGRKRDGFEREFGEGKKLT